MNDERNIEYKNHPEYDAEKEKALHKCIPFYKKHDLIVKYGCHPYPDHNWTGEQSVVAFLWENANKQQRGSYIFIPTDTLLHPSDGLVEKIKDRFKKRRTILDISSSTF